MKTMLKFLALGMLATGFSGLFAPASAEAQVVVAGYAPAVTYYRPRPILRPFTYAPAVTSYYAPSAVSAPVTTYYAPTVRAPITTYYAPTTYGAPVVVPTW